MGYKPKYLQHANLFVRDSEVSREWYADILGLHTYDVVPGKIAFLTSDIEQSHEVALISVGANAPGPEQGRVGLNHTGWQMETLEDLKEFYLRAKAKGVEIDRVADHGISIGIYIQDPDGNGVEVSYELPRSQWHSEENIFSGETNHKGNFPGPWDEANVEMMVPSR